MAAIEKICEATGDYPGPAMYKYKRDHIQVTPGARKLFKGKKALLTFFDPEARPDSLLPGVHVRVFRWYLPKFWTRFYWQWRHAGPFYRGARLEWEFCLYVPEVPGQVAGEYWNHTNNPGRVLRNLEKLGMDMVVDSRWETARELRNRQSSEETAKDFAATYAECFDGD